MQPKDFNISFIDFRILNMSFAVNPNFVERSESVEINPSVSVARDFKEGGKDFFVRLKVSLTAGDIPFFIDVESVGHFAFNEIPDTSLIERTSMINCPAIMFPYVRETIADLTRRAGFAPLHLQPINFVNLAKQITLPQAKDATRKKRAAKK